MTRIKKKKKRIQILICVTTQVEVIVPCNELVFVKFELRKAELVGKLIFTDS